MSMQNEEIIEEMMWIAFESDQAVELAELAGKLIMTEKLRRSEAYDKAFAQLGLTFKDNVNI